MKLPTTPVRHDARVSNWRSVLVCGIAALAVLATVGCNRSRKTYPTISARNPDGGSVSVRGTYNQCPQVFFVASPDHAVVGQTISLTALASDEDGDPLTYSWTADAGTIDSPKAATATLRCTARGAVTITLTVSDSTCGSVASGGVLCQSEDAGSPDGGTAGAGGSGGATGTGGSTGAGGSLGGSVGGGTGGSIGSGTGGTMGGGNTTGGGGATGTGGTSVGGSSGSGACVETDPPSQLLASCRACLTANFNPSTDGCCGIQAGDPTGYGLCQAASACIRGSMCNMSGDSTSCFCGTHAATCDTGGQPNGSCVSQITAAAGRNITAHTTDTPTAAQVEARYGDPNYALGLAVNIQNVAGVFCPVECGYDQ